MGDRPLKNRMAVWHVSSVEEAIPLGAAMLGGIGVGLYHDEQDAFDRVGRSGRTFEPTPDLVPLYDRHFDVYRSFYPALKPVHPALG